VSRRISLIAVVVATIAAAAIGYPQLTGRDDAARRDGQADPGPAAAAAAVDGALPATGMVPVDRQVAFWQGRVDENPTDYLSMTQLGSSLVALAKQDGDLDRYREAEAVFRAALELNPRHPSALLGLGSTRAAEHDFATALDLANQVLDQAPNNANAVAAAGDAHLELGDYEEARVLYARLIDEGRTAPVVSRLARVAWIDGDPDGAVRLSREAAALAADLDLPPAQLAFYDFQEATFLYGSGRIEEAETVARAGLALSPDDGALGELLPKILVAQDRLDEAIASYEALVEGGGPADLHGELAKLYNATGRPDEAAEQIELGLAAAEEAVDEYPAERRHLAGFLIDQDPSWALEIAREDVASRQDIGAYDMLAWALYATGDHEAAAEAMEQALAQGTRDATYLFHAGVIAAAVGDAEAARTHLAAALEINPSFDIVDAAEARETLETLEG
jgi:tetratricopeptide (TPR) repeat protein